MLTCVGATESAAWNVSEGSIAVSPVVVAAV
jgi:hypothetical protein